MKKTISIQKLSLLTLLFIPLLLLLAALYYYLWGFPDKIQGISSGSDFLMFMLILMVSVLIHELIHALCFLIFAKKGLKSVKIGFMWKFFTPYAHCKEPLLKKHYIIALLMPGIVTGVIPTLIGISFDLFYLFCYGLFSILGAGGDLIIYFLAYKIPSNKRLQDHPSEGGFLIFENETL